MATTVFDLQAVLGLDSSKFESGLSRAGSMAKSFGSGIASAAKIGLEAVGAAATAVAGFSVSAIKTGLDFDSAMSQVAATMGMTMDQLTKSEDSIASVDLAWGKFTGNLRDYAQEMGRHTQYTATQAAEALNYMALAGYDVEKSMQTLPSVMALASAGAMDLAKASDMVTDTETAFGLTSERTSLLVDEMARAASTGNTSVEQLGTAFLRLGPTAQELNGGMIQLADGTMAETDGIQQLEVALTAMANAGIKGTRAGTNMLQMILKLSDPTKDGAAQLEKLGVAVFDDEGKMRALSDIFEDFGNTLGNVTQEERIKAMADLFNTRDMAAAKTLMLSLTDGFVKFGDEIYSVDEAYQKWGEDIYDASKGFEFHQAAFDDIAESILGASEAGVLYQGKLYDMATAQEKWGDAIYDTSKGFQVLGAAQFMQMEQNNNLKGDLTFLKSAYEGLQLAISDVFTQGSKDAEQGQGVLRDYVQFATEALSQITDAFKNGGIDAIIPVLGDFLGKGITMITTEGLPMFIDGGIKLLGALGEGLMQNLDAIIDASINIIEQLGKAFIDGAPAIIDAGLQILEALLSAFDENFDVIMDAVQKLIAGIGAAVENHKDGLRDAALSILEKLTNFLIENLDDIARFVSKMLVSFVKWVGDNAGSIIKSAVEIITTLADGLVDSLPELLPAIVETIVAIVEGLIDNVDKLIDSALEIIIALAEGLIDSLPKLIEKAPIIVQKLVDAIIEAVPKLLDAAIEIIGKLAEYIIEHLPEMVKAGNDILAAIGEGIIDLLLSVPKWGNDIMDKIKEGIDEIDVPEWGRDLIRNFIEGMTGGEAMRWLREGVETVAEKIKDFLGFSEPDEGPLSNFHTFAPDMMELYASGIRDNMDLVEDAVLGTADAINSGFDITAEPTYRVGVATANAGTEQRLNEILDILESYMPTYATVQDMESMSINVDNRSFGRLVREVV